MLSLLSPGAALALGLGDIHVESGLGQPIAAQIDLPGATAQDLATVRAVVADEGVFRRHGLERSSFLSSVTLRAGRDSQQRPVLMLSSTEAFSEPMLGLIVELHSINGELVREYTLLLDPPGLAPSSAAQGASALPTTPVAEVAPMPTHITSAPEHTARTVEASASGQTYRVARGDTLAHVAGIAGARSHGDQRRMMVAIFRANPAAFENNLNNLHSGATLHFPSAPEISALSTEEVNREFTAQMMAWRASRRRSAPAAVESATAVVPVAVVPAPAAVAPPNETVTSDSDVAALSLRVQAAERTLAIMKRQLSGGAPAAEVPVSTQTDTKPADAEALNLRLEAAEKALDELNQELRQPLTPQSVSPIVADPAPASPVHDAELRAVTDADAKPTPVLTIGLRVAGVVAAIGLMLGAVVWLRRQRQSKLSLPDAPDTLLHPQLQPQADDTQTQHSPQSQPDLELPFSRRPKPIYQMIEGAGSAASPKPSSVVAPAKPMPAKPAPANTSSVDVLSATMAAEILASMDANPTVQLDELRSDSGATTVLLAPSPDDEDKLDDQEVA